MKLAVPWCISSCKEYCNGGLNFCCLIVCPEPIGARPHNLNSTGRVQCTMGND